MVGSDKTALHHILTAAPRHIGRELRENGQNVLRRIDASTCRPRMTVTEYRRTLRSFETYQIRWSIEVLAKESKQYLGLGRYQGRDFDGQIADCTLCHMTYIALALDKRLNDYETMGALFEEQRADLMALTLWQRLLTIIKRLLDVLADMLGFTYEELSANIVSNEKMLKKYIVMAEALEGLEEAA